MSKAWGSGSTRAWRRTRALVLARDGYRCQLKLPGCTTVATHVHHTIGKGLGDDPANLVASCANCNLAVGDPRRHDPQPELRRWWTNPMRGNAESPCNEAQSSTSRGVRDGDK